MPTSERHRETIVNWIFIVYWLLIFEGALRKWVLPQFQKEIFFIRDPFILVIYFLCLKYRIWPRTQLWTMAAITLMWLGGALLLLQIVCGVIASKLTLLLAIYGWREYFFSIPLAFVIAECFNRDDLLRLVKYTLLVSIPIAILSILQASAQVSSALNAGFADNPANAFVPLDVALGFMRTSGTFTSNEGQSHFIGSLIPMVLWIWILAPERRPLRRMMLWSVTLAVLTNLAVSGQRTAFVLALAVVITTLGAATLLLRGYVARRALKITCGLLFGGAIVAPVLFQGQLNALSVRAAGAAVGDDLYSYGLVNRAAGDFTHFTELIPDAPWLGYGLGIGGNGTTRLGVPETVSAEDDWSRNIVDLGPAFGGLFIGFRILLVASLIAGGVAAARRWGDLLPLLLLGFIGIVLLYGHITGQGSVNGYAWLFAGFCMAASSTARDEACL